MLVLGRIDRDSFPLRVGPDYPVDKLASAAFFFDGEIPEVFQDVFVEGDSRWFLLGHSVKLLIG